MFRFDRPRRFVTGTVGEPGERTFYLQASDGSRTVSVALEKQQVSVLADRLEQLIEEVAERTGSDVPAADADTAALDQPVDEEFRVSAMALAWDADSGTVVIEAQSASDSPEAAEQTLLEDVEDGPDALRVRLEPAIARAFVQRARLVVAAGRETCPLCGLPLDPPGSHVCPRQNGYHRHTEP
jgi:uncharacterized repeat protein (TIGR03847 family)